MDEDPDDIITDEPLTAAEMAEAAELTLQAKIEAAAHHKAASFMVRSDSKKEVEERPRRSADEVSPRFAIFMEGITPANEPSKAARRSVKEATPSPAKATPTPKPASATTPKKAKDAVQPATVGGVLKGESDYGFIMRVKPVFQKLDVNGSGTVDVHELKKVVQAMKMEISDSQAEAMMKHADTNGTGELEFDEVRHTHGLNAPPFCCPSPLPPPLPQSYRYMWPPV